MLAGDFLGAQVLLHGQREVSAALDRGVVGDDHAFYAGDPADAGDHTGGGHRTVVDLMGGQRRELEKGRALVEQVIDTVADEQLAARLMPGARLLATALVDCRGQLAQPAHLGAHRRLVGLETLAARIDLGC